MPEVDAPATLALVCIGYVVLVHFGFRALEHARALNGIPTSAAAGVHMGLNHVQGVARAIGEPLRSPLSSTPCAGWSSRVEDEWQMDSVWRWRRRRRWRTAWEASAETDFHLVDRSGEILVRVAGAIITGHRTVQRPLDPNERLAAAIGPPIDDDRLTGRRRVTELVISLESVTTVVGTARLQEDEPRPELAWDSHDRRQLISSTGVGVTAARHVVTAAWLLLASIAALAVSPLAVRPSDTEYWQAVRESETWLVALSVAAAVVLVAYWLRHVHNDLVRLRERVTRARSLIAIELQRRSDLLPALAEVVAHATDHEARAMTSVASLRAVESNAELPDLMHADSQADQAIRAINAVVEGQPELKTAGNYRQLVDAITVTEDRLSWARHFYNDSVTLYDNRLGEAPASVVARLFHFRPARLYRSAEHPHPSEELATST